MTQDTNTNLIQAWDKRNKMYVTYYFVSTLTQTLTETAQVIQQPRLVRGKTNHAAEHVVTLQ